MTDDARARAPGMELESGWLHLEARRGFRREVEPRIVLEVAFNNVMKSDRHNGGYALRFPRIVRLRPDKPPKEADTIERVLEIYESQNRARRKSQ